MHLMLGLNSDDTAKPEYESGAKQFTAAFEQVL